MPNVSARYNVPENTSLATGRDPDGDPVYVAVQHGRQSVQPYHDAGGALVQGPGPSPHDPVASQLTPADREAYEQVCAAVNAKLAAIQKRSEKTLNAARIAGTPPPVITDDWMPVLKFGLDDLRNRLSPAGWQVVEKVSQRYGDRNGRDGRAPEVDALRPWYCPRFLGASSDTARLFCLPAFSTESHDQNESTHEVIRGWHSGWRTALSLVYARLRKLIAQARRSLVPTAQTGLYRPSDD